MNKRDSKATKSKEPSGQERTRPRSPKEEEIRSGLEPKERVVFDQLVEDYRDTSLMYFSRPFVSFVILADLVRCGWRKET